MATTATFYTVASQGAAEGIAKVIRDDTNKIAMDKNPDIADIGGLWTDEPENLEYLPPMARVYRVTVEEVNAEPSVGRHSFKR